VVAISRLSRLFTMTESTPINQRIILDLCGGTGAWSRPYAKAGYDVRIVTLPEHNILTYEPPENVYGILAAPPCSEFSLVKLSQKRDYKKGMTIVKACLRIINLLSFRDNGCDQR
jgi:hypothetical protein